MDAISLTKPQAAQLLGVAIDTISLDDTLRESLAAIEHRCDPVTFACANPHSLVAAYEDAAFRRALNRMSLVVADGVGLALMSKMLRVPMGPRITGHDYFVTVMEALERRGGGRVFFFGSTPHVLSLIAAKIAENYPHITVCGVYSPPFGEWSEEDDSQMVAMVNAARPDVLWVGMTAPKQEKWVDNNRFRLHVPVIGSIGAVFDFYAGTHPRAPRWMCRMGLEWLYRLCREPRRMWRRNFISTPRFIELVLRGHLLRGN